MSLAEHCAALLLRCRFPQPGVPVVCAVSGGADSLALLALTIAAGFEVTAAHVDHGLRTGSSVEAHLVADVAKDWGAAFRAERVTVAPGPNLEARARAARYAVLPTNVLTGHTADDQAETILLNLLRGSGLDGLTGMAPHGTAPTRPLLALRRTETEALCAALGVMPFNDPSNIDRRHRRNRVRHELLPLMNDIADRDVVNLLDRQAHLMRDEADLLDRLAAELDPTDARALASSPIALARRAVRMWLAGELGGRPPDSAAIERVLSVARGDVLACEVAEGLRISRHRQRMSVQRR